MNNIEYLEKLERVIQEKYGSSVTTHPKSLWDEEKEKEYIKQQKEIYQKNLNRASTKEQLEENGVSITKKLFIFDKKKECEVCEKYSFDKCDDLYLNKYGICKNCYIKYIEDREERWNSGWRPNK